MHLSALPLLPRTIDWWDCDIGGRRPKGSVPNRRQWLATAGPNPCVISWSHKLRGVPARCNCHNQGAMAPPSGAFPVGD
jgi:hypothetical protein